MECCGSPHHEITVQADGKSVTLLRCAHCAEQVWTVDDVPVDRAAAFAHLSSAYASVPRASREARARSAADREARLVERRRQQDGVRADGPDRRAPIDQATSAELSKLLEGWQVLGSTA